MKDSDQEVSDDMHMKLDDECLLVPLRFTNTDITWICNMISDPSHVLHPFPKLP